MLWHTKNTLFWRLRLNNSVDQSAKPLPTFLYNTILFLKRQQRDWKVTVLRTSLDKLAYQMVFPYLSIYIMALGATGIQLGIVNSIGMIVAGFCGPFTGWLIDRIGPKKIYLIGIGFISISYLTYGLAQNWEVTIIAMVGYWLGYATSIHSCATICGNCLVNRDRATGMLICETVAAGLLGVAGPMIGTWLVTQFGGVNTGGIRPLFFSGIVVTIGTFVLVLTQLSEHKWVKVGSNRPHLLRDISHVLKGRKHLKKWLVISAISQLPLGMVFPDSQVFAHSIKGANEFVLGAMVTGSALTSIVFAIPIGRLADRIGRKKMLFLTIPLFWASNLMLILAPSSVILFIAGILQGFYFIGSPITSAIERELVPPEQMGRWLGINRFFKMILSASMALTAGIIWDKIGPQYIFIAFVAVDLLIRMPLLISIPETLHAHLKSDADA
ncbi:MAG: MFS transporter [Syntrophobacterales bacterium]|nr:MAG: MFS transporter [Syntrophobacterales bacterium]